MLGWIGRWAASKGMKLLPNWVGVDKTTAQTSVVSEGFTLGTVTQSDSSTAADASSHNKIISQVPAATTAQEYETTVNLTWRNFTFTPFGFSPSPPVFRFSPSPPVFGFSPTPVFGFSPTPPVFGFSPTPVFGFSPTTAFGFSPSPRCIDQDTPIAVYDEELVIIYKKAKDIIVGDIVWTGMWDEFIDESLSQPTDNPSATLTNLSMQTTEIVGIAPANKSVTIVINGDQNKRFSLEENMLIKRNDLYQFRSTASLTTEDIVLQMNDNGGFDEISVNSIDFIDEDRMVYRFDCEQIDGLIAGDLIVHNGKTFF